jgi:hypothetical protein
MPGDGKYTDPPYKKMTGHILVLNGVTDDGRVIVTDSALAKSGRGYRCQWLIQDFEKVWMKNKGGIGLVICPLDTSIIKEIEEIPPFRSHKQYLQDKK